MYGKHNIPCIYVLCINCLSGIPFVSVLMISQRQVAFGSEYYKADRICSTAFSQQRYRVGEVDVDFETHWLSSQGELDERDFCSIFVSSISSQSVGFIKHLS